MTKYWKSLDGNSIQKKEDKKETKSPTNRRDFLKMFGFGLASTFVLSRCENAAHKAIPYLIKPEEITPSMANYYASSFFDGDKFNSILVKVLDGRPIKIEGNDLSTISQGATNSITQASILSLYDDTRYRKPKINGVDSNWLAVDDQIIHQLKKIKEEKDKIAIVSPTIISPSTQKVIANFKKQYPNTDHIVYDSISASAILDANKESFGKRVVPNYQFDKAHVIVGINADFLGTWLSPVEYTKQYVQNRKVSDDNRKMSRHIQIESGMSLTGSNADERIIINSSEEQNVVANLYNYIAKKLGKEKISAHSTQVNVQKLGDELIQNKGKSLIVCGTNNKETQLLINGINQLLNNYGKTISFTHSLLIKQGNDKQMLDFVNNLESYKGVIFYDCNPIYDYSANKKIEKALKNIDLSISLSTIPDETSELVNFVCPANNYLESWNDFNPKKGIYTIAQPCIQPIFDTRQEQESLLKWAGIDKSYYNYIKDVWQADIYSKTNRIFDFGNFWNKSLQDGILELELKQAEPKYKYTLESVKIAKPKPDLELQLYESVNVGSGKFANNPWLQELPDPVSKVTWDNYAAVSVALANEKNLKTGDVIKINNTIEIPVLVQPGQAKRTISIALGYGRTVAGKSGKDIGADVYQLIKSSDYRPYQLSNITIEKTLGFREFATTQMHDSMEGRDIVRETTLDKYDVNPESGNERHKEIEKLHQTLYKEYEYNGHHWAMAVDLNACTGCNTCVAACSIENNVPIVGKDEVLKAHEMHWMRIDRYYAGDPENPEVVRQPVMCQHCDNAPCENVCPVGATNHSSEGINQMAYNRCIGTRYCNNNCPYKVRRFNWLDYNKADALGNNLHDPHGLTENLPRMVLNPDVTTRAKGVIEKCSFCIQRIQEKKLKAKLENRTLQDGDIKTACQQACPANAIVFGDLNDKNSEVYKLFKQQRRYHLLEELHTLPSVGYLTKVRNNKKS
ncbi:MAG: 4Fe-4S dicluster domain-containing protein [Bacteroidetes bacterium]|nr:4Fe-4S dicluster domain-containing protein [Bacteroidota bacterium]